MTSDFEQTPPENVSAEAERSAGAATEKAIPAAPSSVTSKGADNSSAKWWMLGLGLLGLITVGAALLLANRAVPDGATVVPSDAAPEDVAAAPESAAPEAATPEEQPEDEAAARAEWEAQMQRINAVVGSGDRAALIGDSPTKGPADAPVVLVKFSDFECPYCAIAAAEMKAFTDSREDDVLYVYKHFPLVSIHPEAVPAAKATWAAAQQDQFWIYHDGLFAFQDQLGEDYYVSLAEQIGLDIEQFNRDRNSPEADAAVAQDAALSQQLGLRGTPSFLMTNMSDSFLLPGGAPLEYFEEATDRLMAAAEE